MSGRSALLDVLCLLNQKIEVSQPKYSYNSNFNEVISLRSVKFRYSDNEPWVLNDINLDIRKGSRIGIIGASGAGKSTLMDIILGLLKPAYGSISVDGIILSEENRKNLSPYIAHVPQQIYLSDETVFNNIAFGLSPEDVDPSRVFESARRAGILDVILRLPLQFDTVIGERGVKLSGGQKQRIGIARALFKGAKVIIFDEATSALDDNTESMVMDSIDALDQESTVIIIAHRKTTLSKCDAIYEIKNGRLIS